MTRPILVLTQHRPWRIDGGIEQHVQVFTQGLRAQGLDATVLSPFDGPKLLYTAALAPNKLLKGPTSVLWYDTSRAFLLRRSLHKHLDKSTPALLYLQDPISANVGLEFQKKGYPLELVYAIHYNISVAEEWVGKGAITRNDAQYQRLQERDKRLLPAMKRLIFVSEFMQEQVYEQVPAARKVASHVIPNCVYAPELESSAEGADLVSIGGLEPRKNQGFLLDVLAEAKKLGHVYSLDLIGGGSQEALRTRAQQLGVDGQVRFLGSIPNASKNLGNYRAYVHASKMESFGIVLIEALAAGLPVFAAPVGGVPEVFTDAQEGRYWSLDGARAAAQKLINVLDNETKYAAYSAAAKQRFETTFAATSVAPKLIEAVLGR